MSPDELKELIKKYAVSQQCLAELAQCSQAQVSRLLKSGAKRKNPKYDLIANYVTKQAANEPTLSDEIHPAIKSALIRVWDGTDGQARKIAQVINSLKGFCD